MHAVTLAYGTMDNTLELYTILDSFNDGDLSCLSGVCYARRCSHRLAL